STARSEEKRFVELAVVAKKLVVVALVPVAFRNVKFWSVEEPVVRKNWVVKLVVVALVPVALTKVKFWRVEEAFALKLVAVIRPEEVRSPPLAVVKKLLVLEAVVVKKFVVVAFVPVAFTNVKFWSVEEPVE